jgi:hypothetical protein
MTTNSQPEWLIKLQDIWDRKDTAGFYELLSLCESIRAEALKEVEGIIGEDDIKVENKDDDEETWCDTCGNYYGGEYSTECECDTRNALRKEQRAVLAKLSKGGNNAKT